MAEEQIKLATNNYSFCTFRKKIQMNSTLPKRLISTLKAFSFVLILSGTLLSCQDKTDQTEEVATTEVSDIEATPVVNKRPAPEFFYMPMGMENKRVWICENNTADDFHLKHDCPILLQCKGKGSFRNVILPKAIEFYGRYNCQECSKELDHIFDENAVR